MNKLEQSLREEEIGDEFVLTWKSRRYANKVLVLVEYGYDIDLYYKMFNENTELYFTCGCSSMKKIYNHLRGRLTKYIAIKDSDFDRLISKARWGDNQFITDGHDIEMMVIANEKVRKGIFDNLSIAYKPEIFAKIFRHLIHWSFLRFFNYKNIVSDIHYPKKLQFGKPNPDSDIAALDDIHGTLSIANRFNQAEFLPEENTLITFEDEHRNVDYYELTNGHEFVSFLLFYLKNEVNVSNNLSEDNIRIMLWALYTQDMFKETKLYHEIYEWQTVNHVQILK